MTPDYAYSRGIDTASDPLLLTMVFGKYKGRPLVEVPINYWEWFLKQDWAAAWPGYVQYAKKFLEGGFQIKFKNESATKTTCEDVDALVPVGLKLKQYQREGVAILKDLFAKSPIKILADEMGLGKTAQAIVLAEALGIKRALFLSPASIRLNLQNEVRMFSKSLTWCRVIMKGSDYAPGINAPVTICSYDLLKNLPELCAERFDMICYDEAHYLKSWQARRTPLALRIKSTYKLFMTGTPIPKEAIELHPMISMLYPQWNDFHKFGLYFCNQVNIRGRLIYKGVKNIFELQGLLQPHMVRRLKRDVEKELPPKQYQYIEVEPRTAEAKRIAAESNDLDVSEIFDRSERAKVLENLPTIRRGLGLAKVPAAIEIMESILLEKKKLVVMAYHTNVIDLLNAGLKKMKISSLEISGRINSTKRHEAVTAFQNSEDPRVLVCQIVAAGTGLTMTAADTMLFVEQDWVPATMWQAEDRIHRIGQSRSAHIISLGVSGSIDDRIDRALKTRTAAIKAIIGG